MEEYRFEKHGIHEEINSPPFLIVVLAYFSFFKIHVSIPIFKEIIQFKLLFEKQTTNVSNVHLIFPRNIFWVTQYSKQTYQSSGENLVIMFFY